MSFVIKDLQRLYEYQFGGRPYVVQESAPNVSEFSGSSLTAQDAFGKEVWLPIKFINLDSEKFNGATELMLPYSVIKMSSKKTIVKTALSERQGTVKELFNIDDWQITVKGFVIAQNRVWPEEELIMLRTLNALTEAVELDNALSNIFLDKGTRVVIEDLELPEVQGGRKHIRPFSFKIESDSIFTLELT